MQSIREIIEDDSFVSAYSGSLKTKEMVEEQIEKNYNPYKNALTFANWIRLGYRPKKGSKALKSVTFIEKRDALGNVIQRYPRKINLFYYRSVEPITNQE